MSNSLKDTLERADKDGVKYILTISTEDKSFNKILDIVTKHKNVYGTYGIHPHEAKHHKSINSKIEFSSDFIIGYPGETEEDFNASLKLLKEVEFINTYSFLYSPRPGTPASKLGEIEESILKKRLKIFA